MDKPSRPSRRTLVAPSRALALAGALALAVIAPRVYAQVRMAVVDVQRAALETDQGRQAKTQLKALFEKRQSDLDSRQQALKRMRDDIEKAKTTSDPATIQRRTEDYQKQLVDLQQNFLDSQQELSQREAELTKQIYANMQNVIRQIGQAENYTVIFDQAGVVWSPQHMDLTDRIIQAYNQQYPPARQPATPPAGAQTPPTKVPGRAPVNPHPREEQPPPHAGGH